MEYGAGHGTVEGPGRAYLYVEKNKQYEEERNIVIQCLAVNLAN